MSDLDLDALAEQFATFHARFAPLFYRAEVRARSARYLRALLSPIARKNGWQVAEAMGEADPNGAQRLLYAARWDADGVRDELQRFVMEHFGDPDGGILIVDETGFLKKGDQSVGVARQYSGTAGKVDNCQVGVFLGYASPRGATFLDRRLYLPDGWATDPARRATAHVPTDVVFQTKPTLARTMLAQAFTNGVVAGWVSADSLYGCDRALWVWLARRRQPFVLGVRRDERVWVDEGDARRQQLVATVADELPATAWQRLSAGNGSKGPRWFDWAWVPIAGLRQDDWQHWLLVRRSVSEPTDLAYSHVAGPAATTLAEAVRVAGARWTIEQCLEEAKGETGLDEYEVRSWPSWYRHITLSLVAHAFLAWARQTANAAGVAGDGAGRGAMVGAGNATAAGADAASLTRQPSLPVSVVGLATATSGPGTQQSLPSARRDLSTCPASPYYVRL